jgi:hypothetical protein
VLNAKDLGEGKGEERREKRLTVTPVALIGKAGLDPIRWTVGAKDP